MKNTVKIWLGPLFHLFFPRCCVVCGAPLVEGEEAICTHCNINMPRTNYHKVKDNLVERMFWGKIPLERATSYFFYRKGSDFRKILHQFKYGGRKELGAIMGRFMAAELATTDFFEGVDIIIPVPLHPRGVSQVVGLPVDVSSAIREKHTDTQTRKSTYERWENVDGIFRLRHPENFVGKHVLIVDDVLTTGSTTTACADVFHEIEGVRICVLTLAVAEG